MAGESGDDQVAWYNAWGQLKQTIQRLDQAVASLQANRDFALSRPNLAQEYQEKMDEVESMREKAIWIRDQIRYVFDLFGVELSGVRQQMGALPAVILWPAVAGAVAWLGSKALDLWKFSQMVDEQRRLESKGVAPEQAAMIVRQNQSTGTLADTFRSVTPVLLLVVGGLLAWKLMPNRRGRD